MTTHETTVDQAVFRYTKVAIWLHWLIAGLLVGLIFVGWNMGDAPREVRFQIYQMHKTFGILVLLLTLARILWRLMNPPPPEPLMPGWQKAAAGATHVLFYGLMLALPLSGWAYVSASPAGVPTLLFGQAFLQWPHMPFFADMALEARKALAGNIENAHGAMAWGVLGLLGLHVLAALKHQFIDRDRLLARMAPGVFGRTYGAHDDSRGALIAFGVPILLAAALIVYARTAGGSAVLAPPVTAEDALGASSVPVAGGAGSVVDPAQLPGDNTPAADATPAPLASAGTGPTDPAPASAGPAASGPVARPAPEPAASPVPAPAPAPAPPAEPVRWTLVQGESSIYFRGQHDGNPFAGTFSRWQADIRFSPDALGRSSVTVEIDLGSASAGNAFYDTTLREPDWFDSARVAKASFKATRFTSQGGNSYTAEGTLTLRGKSVPVSLPFRLDINGDRAEVTGGLIVERLQWDIGRASDEGSEYVENNVSVEINVTASKAG